MAQLRNPHPGEILKEEFLNETGSTDDPARYIPRIRKRGLTELKPPFTKRRSC